MTILFFSRLFSPHIGGVEKHVLEISKQMIQDGHRVIVVTENHGWSPTENIDSIQIYRIDPGENEKQKKFRIWSWIWKNRKLIQKADIVHCHDVFFWYLPFRFLYPSKKIYTTFHGYETIYPPSKKAILIRKLSAKLSNGNMCVGKYIEKWYETKATCITYGGVLLPIRTNTHQSKNKQLNISFIGRLEEDTGVPIYLHALEQLKKNKMNYTFNAYGDGSLKTTVEKYGQVHSFQKDITKEISTADIIFASSYLSILEAFSQKKIVYSVFDNPLKKDYLTMTPFARWINITNSAKELAKKITHLIKNKDLLEKQADEAYNWVQMQTWGHVTKTYYSLWKYLYEKHIYYYRV